MLVEMFQCGLDIFAALMNNQLTRGLAIPCSLGCFDVTCFFIMKKADMEEKMSAFLYEKAQCGIESTLGWLLAMRPVAEWRPLPCKKRGATPNPRAARPVAERR